jgi:hypothetical protein
MPLNRDCRVCLRAVERSDKEKVSCTACGCWLHGACAGLKKVDLDYINGGGGAPWRCDSCVAVRRISGSGAASPLSPSVLPVGSAAGSLPCDITLESLAVLIQNVGVAVGAVRSELSRVETDLGGSLELTHTKLDDYTAQLAKQSELINNLVGTVDVLTRENDTLKNRVVDLESKLEDLQQYSRRNCIEIQGVPEERNEDVVGTVTRVGESLGFPIAEGMLDACHRLARGPNQKHRPIIVKFVRRFDKDSLLARRRLKPNFCTRDLGIQDNETHPIFLNECLSPARKRLLAEARVLQRQNKFKFLWVRNGSIRVRKVEGGPVIIISSKNDLAQFD